MSVFLTYFLNGISTLVYGQFFYTHFTSGFFSVFYASFTSGLFSVFYVVHFRFLFVVLSLALTRKFVKQS